MDRSIRLGMAANLPVNLTLVLEETHGNAVHGRIAPPLVEETSCAVKMIKVLCILFAAPEAQIGDFKVGPKMAGRVPMSNLVMTRFFFLVFQKRTSIVFCFVFGVVSKEFEGLRPQRSDRLRAVKKGDGEAVGLVVILHPTEHVIVNVAEEMNFGLDTPVVLHVGKGRVFVELAAVPAAHLVVRVHVGILDILLGEKLLGLIIEVLVDPRGNVPMLSRNGI